MLARLRTVFLAVVAAELEAVMVTWTDEITHQCPPKGQGLTPCCGKAPFELSRADRLTVDPSLVTCPGPVEVTHA
jgi:hypothetical protein